MKASERLRELSDRPLLHMTEVEPLLPLIADVVEAAEHKSAHDFWRNQAECPLCAALTALSDALSGSEIEWPDGDEVGQPTC